MNNIIRLDLYRYGGKKQILKGFKHEGFVYTFFLEKPLNLRNAPPWYIL